jgi:hypothetical protein
VPTTAGHDTAVLRSAGQCSHMARSDICFSLTLQNTVLLEKLNVCSASQEITSLLWNPMVHYCVHKSLPPMPIPSQMNPIHTLQPYFLKIHLHLYLPSGLFPSGFPTKSLYRFIISPCMLYAPPISPSLISSS